MPMILLALTSHGQLGHTGRTTGFYAPEAAAPHRIFTAAGYDVGFVSVQGGAPPCDGVKDGDTETAAFLRGNASALAATPAPADLDPAGYAAIFFVGGHGAMWDFPGSTALAQLATGIYTGGGVIAAVCHGPAALASLQIDGTYLVDGKRVTSFTNDEETAVGLIGHVPFALETRLIERGARFVKKADFAENTVTDGRLVTGQNPASAARTAQQVIQVLDAAPRPHG